MEIEREQLITGDQVTFTAKVIGPDYGTTDRRVCVELADSYLVWLPIDRIVEIQHKA